MGINSNLKGVFSLKGSIILIVLLFSLQVFAGLRLPALVGSNMVLQRNTEIKVWGWGNPGDKVTVKADWIKAESSGTVGADSMWQVKVLTGNAGGPYKMMIYEKDEVIRLENIMLGEVWVCSGQSNMEFTIKMFWRLE
ncbi:MAG: hypothetical protein IPH88_09190 [Bacteroidales bacterium]|nr:hypothetical protein [Bacteroidales bacterium]